MNAVFIKPLDRSTNPENLKIGPVVSKIICLTG